MKRLLLYLFIFLAGIRAYGHSVSGIYVTASDFVQNKLSYTSDCKNNKDAIQLHTFLWNTSAVSVVSNGKKYKLKKNDLYGYRDCTDKLYRFYKNDEYSLVEAGSIYIYTQSQNITLTKGFSVVYNYYFSATPGGDIVPLNYSDLLSAYSGNAAFLELLERFFPNRDVTAYDAAHKMYKLNYVFQRLKVNANQ